MGAEVKYLGDGSAVLALGEGPNESTSLDGGRTLTEVPTVVIARLTTENVHPEQLYDEAPEIDPETGAIVGDTAPVQAPANEAAVAARGEAQNADQLDAEIARLTAERDALAKSGGNPPTGAPHPGATA